MANVARDEETRPGVLAAGREQAAGAEAREAPPVADAWAEEMRRATGFTAADEILDALGLSCAPRVDPWCLME